MQTVVRKAEQEMKRAIDATLKTFNGVRTGRASISLVEGIQVDYHGTMTPLHQLANLATPERRMMTIQPWDPTAAPPSRRPSSSPTSGSPRRMTAR